MWGVALALFATFIAGFLVGGGPTLWFALVVGLAVLGGDPSDPISAAIATLLALGAAEVVRAQVSASFRRRAPAVVDQSSSSRTISTAPPS